MLGERKGGVPQYRLNALSLTHAKLINHIYIALLQTQSLYTGVLCTDNADSITVNDIVFFKRNINSN